MKFIDLTQNADTDLSNVSNADFLNAFRNCGQIYLKTSVKNGSSGYNVWSNGYCEQWGILQTDNTTRTELTATFEKEFTDLPVVTTTRINNGSTSSSLDLYNGLKSVTTQAVTGYVWNAMPIHWKATGYINEA